MPTQAASFTNHPGVIDFKGNSYFFYHNGALPGGDGLQPIGVRRAVQLQRRRYNPHDQDDHGGRRRSRARLNPFVQTEAETIAGSRASRRRSAARGTDVTSTSATATTSRSRASTSALARCRSTRAWLQRAAAATSSSGSTRPRARCSERARFGHGRRADMDDAFLRRQRSDRRARSLLQVHGRQRCPVQLQLVEVHTARRGQ